jgi:hypothetical protein
MDAAMTRGREIEGAGSTLAQLQSDIDRGHTGDKVLNLARPIDDV